MVAKLYPLYPANSSPIPPRGASAASPETSASNISPESVIACPSLPITIPAGVSFPSRSYNSIFPRWTIEVAASNENGNSSPVGIDQVKGFVPSLFSTLNVGAIDGRAFVPETPMQPSLAAISV